jgi:hypothetical protein
MDTRALLLLTTWFLTGCPANGGECETVLDEIPLFAGSFEPGVELAHTPPSLFVTQGEMVWNVPSDTTTVHAVVSLADYGDASTLVTEIAEYALGDTLTGSEVYMDETSWDLELNKVTTLDLVYSIDRRPKSLYIRHEGPASISPLSIFRLEVERLVCSD